MALVSVSRCRYGNTMSTILRALKKLEHDRASGKRRQEELELDFLDSPPPVPRRSPLKSALTVLLLLACGSAATFLFMGRTGKKVVPSPPAATPRVRQAAFKISSAGMTRALPLANNSSAAIRPTPVGTPLQASRKPIQRPSAIRASEPPPVLLTNRELGTEQHAQHVPVTSRRLNQPVSSQLTVNGIALSDGEKRKAIVNGVMVSVGAVIEGARVEDIQEHRVFFSRGGRSFVVTVGNSGP